MNPYVFDNTYYKELMLGERSKYYKTDADRALMAKKPPDARERAERFVRERIFPSDVVEPKTLTDALTTLILEAREPKSRPIAATRRTSAKCAAASEK